MDLITLIEWCFHFSVKGRQEAGGDDRGWLYHTLKAQQIGIDASWSSSGWFLELLMWARLEEQFSVGNHDSPLPVC